MIAALAVLTAGCVRTEEINVADIYRKAYITTDIYPQNEGHYNTITTNTPPSFSITDGHLVKNNGGEVVSYSGIKSYKVFLRTNYAVEKAVSGKFSVPSDAEELVAKYNSDNGYTGDEEYSLLPSSSYTIGNAVTTIPAGNKEGEPFVFEFNDGLEAMELGNYIVPLVCTLEEGAGIELAEGQDMVFMKFSNIYNDEAGNARSERILYNNVDFTYSVGEESSFYDAPYDAGALFNDDVTDICYCNEQYSDLTITFNEPVLLSRLGLVLTDPSYSNTYYWLSWNYANGDYGDVGGNYLYATKTAQSEITWLNLSADYLNEGQKLQDLYWLLYYNGYNFSEIYFIAYDE